MKQTLIFLTIVFLTSACRIDYIPLKGNYPSDYTVVFDKSADQVMTNIIEYCLKNNISLKVIDRKNGLIMSEPYRINTFTFESANGIPEDSSSRVIVGREKLKNYSYEPELVLTDIIFQVKEEENRTSMTVMLANMVAYITEKAAYTHVRGLCLKEVRSTGFLEKQIIERMK
ncbi:hypothetical protein [Emticicia sp. C21]|uniref:hypothetical protein n=1 Tax=Emticicia sp. C21 TaxID=2302915 RepID=UPI000E345D45|nr:hypothetical protein [Emticicia sp. C21]RFS17691.1 hypothetical protein D0T08_00085 [Emticicia sp. C21]